MDWRNLRRSGNVEDRRGGSGGLIAGGGIGSIVIALLAYFLGFDPGSVGTDQTQYQQAPSSQSGQAANPEQDSLVEFVKVVLGSTEDVWNQLFQQQRSQYQEPHLVLFSGQVQSACGMAGAAVGPFYCSQDAKVYIDLSFYRELRSRFHAPGDFAEAYVIAHEVGHHVQNLLGISEQVARQQQRSGKTGANALSVRLELQADFFAGVWAHYAQQKGILDPGDIEEALNAASAIGDDKLQQEAQGYVVPDAFTHGTSAQRSRWFKKGYETGDMKQGDTFSTENL